MEILMLPFNLSFKTRQTHAKTIATIQFANPICKLSKDGFFLRNQAFCSYTRSNSTAKTLQLTMLTQFRSTKSRKQLYNCWRKKKDNEEEFT